MRKKIERTKKKLIRRSRINKKKTMNVDFLHIYSHAMPMENIGTHAATCDRVVQFFT